MELVLLWTKRKTKLNVILRGEKASNKMKLWCKGKNKKMIEDSLKVMQIHKLSDKQPELDSIIIAIIIFGEPILCFTSIQSDSVEEVCS